MTLCDVQVIFRANSNWDVAARLFVTLESPVADDGRDVAVGELGTTSIVILNVDKFPNGKDPAEVNPETGKPRHNEVAILWAFVMHLYRYFSHDAHMGLIYRMYPAVHWIMSQLLMLLALNNAVDIKDNITAFEYRSVMYALAIIYLTSLTIQTIASWRFLALRLGGQARRHLREAVLATMLHMTEKSGAKFGPGQLLGVAAEEVEITVLVCWRQLFALWEQLIYVVALCALTAFLVASTPTLYCIPFLLLLGDCVVFTSRSSRQVELSEVPPSPSPSPDSIHPDPHSFQAHLNVEHEWKDQVGLVSEVRNLIVSYKATSGIVKQVGEVFHKGNDAKWFSDNHGEDTAKMIHGMHAIAIVVCFIAGAEYHRADAMAFPVGNYVTLVATMFKYDTVILKLFELLDDLNIGFAHIEMLAAVLNSDTRHQASLRMRKESEAMKDLRASFHDVTMDLYEDDISMDRVTYIHTENGVSVEDVERCIEQSAGEECDGCVIGPFNFSIEQGQLVCLASAGGSVPHGQGKSTLLKLLGGILLPTRGRILFPQELRRRYVPTEPLMWKGSLMKNLRFGNVYAHGDAEDDTGLYTDEDVWSLWTLLGGSSKYVNKGHMELGTGGDALSSGNAIVLGITRALLSDVDVLLLGGTLDVLGELNSTNVIKVLRRWVKNRGLAEISQRDASLPIGARQRKTLFMTTKYASLSHEADTIVFL